MVNLEGRANREAEDDDEYKEHWAFAPIRFALIVSLIVLLFAFVVRG